MDFLPSFTSAMVAAVPGSGGPARFTGSCAAFTSREVFLTAAHCAPPDEDLEVTALIEGGTARTVIDRAYHPTSDLALLRTEPHTEPGLTAALSNQIYRRYSAAVLEDGGQFICAGFPGELPSPTGVINHPISRVIRGHFQRWFRYTDPGGRSYFAFELSCPAPAGLSGSVIAYTNAPDVAVAVVTANHDAYTLIDRLEDVDRDGRTVREQINRVVSYGIAAGLHGQEAWLDETLRRWPQPPS